MSGMTVLIVVIDALRQDHVGCYGYERGTTPTIDWIANEPTTMTYRYVTPQSSWTRPSVASLLTSLYPEDHGVFGMRDSLISGIDSLPRVLKRSNFRTVGYVANPNVGSPFGFGEHFDEYKEFGTYDKSLVSVFCTDIEKGAVGRETPLFAYVHLFGPHSPYDKNNIWRSRYVNEDQLEQIDEYDAAVHMADSNVLSILNCIRQNRDWNNTLIIITADHGEAFYEHGLFGHGNTLFDEEIKIPFLLRTPVGLKKALYYDDRAYELRDVPATILDILSIPQPSSIQGVSICADRGSEEYGIAYSVLKRGVFDLEASTTTTLKLVQDNRLGVTALFDRTSEYIPINDRFDDPVVKQLDKTINARRRSVWGGKPLGWISDETREDLEAIGYMD